MTHGNKSSDERTIVVTIDQYAVLASVSVAVAAMAIWWVLSKEWTAMGRHKAPLWVAVLAVVFAALQVQRYLRLVKQRLPDRGE